MVLAEGNTLACAGFNGVASKVSNPLELAEDANLLGCLPLAALLFYTYICCMVSRTYGRGRPLNAPAAFIHPCQPIVAKQTASSTLSELDKTNGPPDDIERTN